MTKENELAALEYLKRYKINQPRIEMGVWITLNVLIGIAMVALIWA